MFERLRSLGSRFKNFFKEEKVEKEKRIERGEVDRPSETVKKMDRAKSNAESDAAMWKRKYKKLRDSIERREEVNIGKELQEEKERISEEKFKNAVSLKGLMNKIQNMKVDLVSAHGETEFGRWDDVALLNNGQMAMMAKNNEEKKPVITGRTWRDMLRDHKNPAKSVSKGLIHVNLDGQGNFVENLDAERVPDIVQDAEGNFVQTSVHKQELMKKLADKERKIRDLQQYIGGLEGSWLGENEEVRRMDRARNLQKKRSDTGESVLSDELEKTKRIIEDDRLKDRAMAENINAFKIERDIENRLYGKREQIMDKMSEWFPEEQEERVKGKTKKMLSWLMTNVVEPSAVKHQEALEETGSEESESESSL